MDFLPEPILEYAEAHTSPETEVLKNLNRYTYANLLMPRMLSGHIQGRMLSMFSKMIKPKYILEIGTFTGYSAICLAEGLQHDGMIHSIEINEELKHIINKFITEANIQSKFKLHIGMAAEIIPAINAVFDLVFIDADKENYSAYFDLIIDRVNKGGFIIADNVLWSGKVLTVPDKKDVETKALIEFNKKVMDDARVANVMMPVRDGLMLMQKL
jgi:predicted O-methyltransferase YrrM